MHRVYGVFLLVMVTLCHFGHCGEQTTALSGCLKHDDCGLNQQCHFYDNNNDSPVLWPPCPHFGICLCDQDSILISNGSCIQSKRLSVGDNCSMTIFERFNNPNSMKCDEQTLKVTCLAPFVVDEVRRDCVIPTPNTTTTSTVGTTVVLRVNGSTVVSPVNGTTKVPIVNGSTLATNTPTVFPNTTTQAITTLSTKLLLNLTIETIAGQLQNQSSRNSSYSSYLEQCDNDNNVFCDLSQSLCCLRRGPDPSYQQCQCCDPHSTFDVNINKCRLRIYGDLCINDEDCNSGLIASNGFQCRQGKCRCIDGYNAVDASFWNETSKAMYIRRICIVQGASTSVPTGDPCTMNPHKRAQLNSTKVCHSRAFCHQCFRERISYDQNDEQQSMGICREVTCSSNNQCPTSMVCNKFDYMLDPPCENGLCDCDRSKFQYMNRFSRCDKERILNLGDRCILGYPNGLHPWFHNNERFQQGQSCYGYGKIGGVTKCKSPHFEEIDGRCIANEDSHSNSTQLLKKLNFGETCNLNDLRLPKSVCDTDKNLKCATGKCDCAESNSTSSRFFIWDGETCRKKKFGDPCQDDMECWTGFYPSSIVGSRCRENVCACNDRLFRTTLNSLTFDNGASEYKLTAIEVCLPENMTIVNKGSDCHVDPVGYAEGYLAMMEFPKNILVCDASSGLVCLRCPTDFNPDDEQKGICRTFKQSSSKNVEGPSSGGGDGGGNVNNGGVTSPGTNQVSTPKSEETKMCSASAQNIGCYPIVYFLFPILLFSFYDH